ncbi:hypothetical protein HPP92_011908 [Vanilla planifolia]|uniref:Uncharacterized protein n=1 Tax=Vanilla planifolia TaxID=51239 RepID=A0A835R3U6_VANPL|nr:hypothetical protein HPP92_011908 [Vanilla planifolia]
MTVTTNEKGYFKTEIHLSSSSKHPKCIVKLLGGPEQLYTSKKSMVSKIAKAEGMDDYKLSTPLTVLSSFPTNKQPEFSGLPEMGSSKTFNLPLPREWGLPPSSYCVPYFPIIGIP